MAAAFRAFQHPDERKWQVRSEGAKVELRIDAGDGEWVERSRTLDDSDAAAAEESSLVAAQIADGFVEVSKPRWVSFIDGLVANWNEDDPSFEAAALRDALVLYGEPQPIAEALMRLAARWVTNSRGQTIRADTDDAFSARAWLQRRVPVALPGLLLALRHPDHDAQLAVEGILCDAPRQPDALPALWSVLEHPPPNRAGRAQHIPIDALRKLGKPEGELAAKGIALLGHPDFRCSDAAAKLLAEFADDDALLESLWRLAEPHPQSDGLCWALLRAAEVRRDRQMHRYLLWMLQSPRFQSVGYGARITSAISALR